MTELFSSSSRWYRLREDWNIELFNQHGGSLIAWRVNIWEPCKIFSCFPQRTGGWLCCVIEKCSFVIFRRRIVHKEVFFGDQRSLFTSCYAVCINLENLDYVARVMRSCHWAILRKQFLVVKDFCLGLGFLLTACFDL